MLPVKPSESQLEVSVMSRNSIIKRAKIARPKKIIRKRQMDTLTAVVKKFLFEEQFKAIIFGVILTEDECKEKLQAACFNALNATE